MQNASVHTLDQNQIRQYSEKQINREFCRNVNGNCENVSYPPGSSLRFWINTEATEYPLHWHPALEIIMPLQNSYTVQISEKEYHLQQGDIFCIPPGEPHHLIAPAEGSRLIYLIDFTVLSRISGFSSLKPYLATPFLLTAQENPSVHETASGLIIQMCNEYFSDNPLRELMVYSSLIRFFVCLGNYWSSSITQDSSESISVEKYRDLTRKLNIVFDFLENHYMDDITLEKAASVAGFSKFHFSRLFQQCTGYHFYDYLCYRRNKAAEELLLNPALSITDIASMSGFSSLSTFNRTFKRFRNCTPSEYRKLYLNSQPHSLLK